MRLEWFRKEDEDPNPPPLAKIFIKFELFSNKLLAFIGFNTFGILSKFKP
jgi:hypothetical protein